MFLGWDLSGEKFFGCEFTKSEKRHFCSCGGDFSCSHGDRVVVEKFCWFICFMRIIPEIVKIVLLGSKIDVVLSE